MADSPLSQREIELLHENGVFMVPSIAQSIVGSICFGLNTIIFAFAVYCLSARSVKTRAWYIKVMLTVTLFSMSITLYTIERYIFFSQTRKVMMSTNVDSYDDRIGNAYAGVGDVSYAAQWLFSTAFLISDAIVIQRTWVLWQGTWPMILPIVLWIASLGVLIAERVLAVLSVTFETPVLKLAPDVSDGAHSVGAASYALSVAANAAATSLVAVRAWEYRKIIKGSFGHPGQRSSTVGQVLAMLVESGLIYLCFWGVYIITNVGAASSTDLGSLSLFIELLAAIGDHMVAIYPTIIIALVERQCSIHDTVVDFSFPTERSDSEPDSRGVIDSRGMAFASASVDNATLPGQKSSSTARAEEVELQEIQSGTQGNVSHETV